MKTLHDLTLQRFKQQTIYHDTVRAISLASDLQNQLYDVSYVFSENANHSVARRRTEKERTGNKLKRMNGDTKMTFKFGRGENDRNIHMSCTLRASRVIGWYSDIKKLSFAFIPSRNEGHLFEIKGPLGSSNHSLSPLLLYLYFRQWNIYRYLHQHSIKRGNINKCILIHFNAYYYYHHQ